jgi:hypothetical protein
MVFARSLKRLKNSADLAGLAHVTSLKTSTIRGAAMSSMRTRYVWPVRSGEPLVPDVVDVLVVRALLRHHVVLEPSEAAGRRGLFDDADGDLLALIPTLPRLTRCGLFLRRTLRSTGDGRRCPVADALASLSALRLCGLSRWPLTHSISTGMPTRSAALISVRHSSLSTTGLPSRVRQRLAGHVEAGVLVAIGVPPLLWTPPGLRR